MPAKHPLRYAWLVLVLVVAPLHRFGSCASAETASAGQAATRFFIDEGYFLEGDTEILRAYISASKGRMMISGESSAAFLSVKVRHQLAMRARLSVNSSRSVVW